METVTIFSWYVGLGIFVLVVLRLIAKSKEQDNQLAELIPSIQEAWWERWLVPVIGYTFIILIWPVLLLMKLRELIFNTEVQPLEEPEPFKVKKSDLIQEMTLNAIEEKERVSDPLNAVSDLPFGHLNSAWMEFTKQFEKNDSEDGNQDCASEPGESVSVCDEGDAPGAIWVFESQREDEWSRTEHRKGYVIVYGDSIGPYFLTDYRRELISN